MIDCEIIYERDIKTFYEKIQENLNNGYRVISSNISTNNSPYPHFYAYMEKEYEEKYS